MSASQVGFCSTKSVSFAWYRG